jgi:hypothetical protein
LPGSIRIRDESMSMRYMLPLQQAHARLDLIQCLTHLLSLPRHVAKNLNHSKQAQAQPLLSNNPDPPRRPSNRFTRSTCMRCRCIHRTTTQLDLSRHTRPCLFLRYTICLVLSCLSLHSQHDIWYCVNRVRTRASLPQGQLDICITIAVRFYGLANISSCLVLGLALVQQRARSGLGARPCWHRDERCRVAGLGAFVSDRGNSWLQDIRCE